MKENMKKSVFEEPKLQVVHLTETDIITTSGDPVPVDPPEIPQESELI